MPIKAIELFCGAGLMGEGFSRAGFSSIYAADLDGHAIKSYNKNLKNKVGVIKDVALIDANLKGDVIIAGPPCQGFSTLGKRDKKDARNKLSLLLTDWAKSTKAKVVVIENVPQFLSSEYHKILVRRFTQCGFENVSWTLNAHDYGAPQNRVRSFTIFSKIGLPDEPAKIKKRLTVADAFRGLNPKADSDGMHAAPSTTELARQRIKHVPTNGNKLDLMRIAPNLCPKSWFTIGSQAVDVWGRMNYEAPSNTIRCCFLNPSKGKYLHPVEDRVITLREGARLQGIPDKWEFEGSRASIARQIGNGVPIPLAEAVGSSIKKLF